VWTYAEMSSRSQPAPERRVFLRVPRDDGPAALVADEDLDRGGADPGPVRQPAGGETFATLTWAPIGCGREGTVR
jgi:hypothetical protein